MALYLLPAGITDVPLILSANEIADASSKAKFSWDILWKNEFVTRSSPAYITSVYFHIFNYLLDSH